MKHRPENYVFLHMRVLSALKTIHDAQMAFRIVRHRHVYMSFHHCRRPGFSQHVEPCLRLAWDASDELRLHQRVDLMPYGLTLWPDDSRLPDPHMFKIRGHIETLKILKSATTPYKVFYQYAYQSNAGIAMQLLAERW
jgi:hypothetical protein